MAINLLCVVVFSFNFLSTTLGNCVVNDFEEQENFNVSAILGEWYGFMWLPVTGVQPQPLIDYSIEFKNKENYIEKNIHARENNTDCCSTYKTKLYKTDKPTLFDYEMDLTDDTINWYKTNFSVMSTDYDGYLIFYGCSMAEQDGTCGRNNTFSEIYTRSTNVSATQNQTIQDKVEDLCLKTEEYFFSVHEYECKTGKACKDNGDAGTRLLDVFLIFGAILIQSIIHL